MIVAPGVEEDTDNKRNGFKLLNDRLWSMVGFGYTLLEAIACDLCILGYAVGGTLGMMRNGVNWFATRAATRAHSLMRCPGAT